MKEKINNLILELNSTCNSNCIYCYLDKKDDMGKESVRFFKQQLAKFAECGVRNVDFTGGEPTLYKGLFDLIKFARKIGFTKRTLVTNGRRLAYKNYCDKLIKNGVNRIVISLDGPNKKITESITRSPGSFRQTINAINNIKKFDTCELGITIVINALNYKYIPRLVEKCISLNVDFVNFQHILPYIEDKHVSCRKLPSWVIPSYKETEKYVAEALDKFGEKIKIRIHFIPFCCLKGYERYLLDEASKHDRYALNYREFGYNIGKHLTKAAVKTKKCEDCGYNDKCIGFFRSYAKAFGILDNLK